MKPKSAVAEAIANQTLKEYEITKLPVCPFTIADKKEIPVEKLPSSSDGVSGMLVHRGNDFGIMYATHLGNAGFERFSIAHELGHFVMPGHHEAVLRDGDHTSRAGFTSADLYEREADLFAAALLMPAKLFREAMRGLGTGLEAIEALAATCATSLTSTAIRYAQKGDDAVAVVISTGDTIDYCFMSERLSDVKGLTWIRRGDPLPNDSLTRTLGKDSGKVREGCREVGQTTLDTWLGGTLDVEVAEEVVGLGRYGKTLTVLTAEDLPDEAELEEEAELVKSWTPRFRR